MEAPTNENDYLELCNQLKELNETRDSREKEIETELVNYKKDIMTIYGLIRTISNTLEPENYDAEVYVLVDVLRGYVSEIIENHILKIDI